MEYEDIEDYATPIRNAGFDVIEMVPDPFGFTFGFENGRFKLSMALDSSGQEVQIVVYELVDPERN